MKATYNITNDKLKFWPEERLPQERYQYARKCGFAWWPGSKCFAAKWNPRAEDLILEMGGVIEADDTPDDLESRVQRFEKYAERAQDQAAGGEARLETANTDRRKEHALAAVEKGLSEAAHWQRRIQGAIRRAAYREEPAVIARRIRGLETDRRREVNSFTIKAEMDGGVIVGGGRGGHWITKDKLPAIQAEAERWIAHIDKRLAYENACLEAAGGCHDVLRPQRKKAVQPKGPAKARDGKPFEVGGAAGFHRGYAGNGPLEWRLVQKVNRSTVELVAIRKSKDDYAEPTGPHVEGQKPVYTIRKVEAYGLSSAKTAEEVRAELPDLYTHWVNLQRILKAREEIKARHEAKAQEAKELAQLPLVPAGEVAS